MHEKQVQKEETMFFKASPDQCPLGTSHFPFSAQRKIRISFTLIELLVVVAVIGILTALLLPSLQLAKDAALSSQCLGNVRQYHLSYMSYFSDFDDWLTTGNRPFRMKTLGYLPGKNETGTLHYSYFGASGIHACPAERNSRPRDNRPNVLFFDKVLDEDRYWCGSHYGFNERLNYALGNVDVYGSSKLLYWMKYEGHDGYGYAASAKIHTIRYASEVVFFGEKPDRHRGTGSYYLPPETGTSPGYRHGRGSRPTSTVRYTALYGSGSFTNIGWLDGHASRMSWREIEDLTTNRNWRGL
jgi:prepilin-type N-terminal cleavage/methylation domain-containing protein/prepilin-type processing-associated H-X9-DG protein